MIININKKILTVEEVNKYIKSIFEEDFILNEIFVEGEISNYKKHSSGHLYFTIKDKNASINCVMFKGNTWSLNFLPEDGMKIIIFGKISLYEKTGTYQIYTEFMEPSGIGGLYLAFEQLKNKLEQEGLFEKSFKKNITENPKCVAIITSKTGAAIQDIINISKRRNKNIELIIVPTLVQGKNASKEIVEAIELVNEWNKADTIILARGGGSLEDLWAFNEEIVARSIFNSKIPIVSAIGHETDFTIADFVSDLRAPTPSAGAEIVIPELKYQIYNLKNLLDDLTYVINTKLEETKINFETKNIVNYFNQTLEEINLKKKHIYNLNNILIKNINLKIERKKNFLYNKINLLEKISPLKILSRGFSIVEKNNQIITNINNLNENDKIKIQFKNGQIEAKVLKIIKGD